MKSAIIRQFRRPSGLLGRLAGMIMASRPSNQERNRWTIELLALSPTDHYFELGCGPGFALALAAEKTREGFVTGVDHSATMVRMARRRLKAPLCETRAEIQVGDQQALCAFDGTLNAISSANVIQFLDAPEKYFEIAYAALAPGGRIATTYQPRGKNPSWQSADDKAKACSDAMSKSGFTDIRTEWLSLKPIPAMCVVGSKGFA